MKTKKIIAVAAAAVLLVSTASMPATAVSTTFSLAKNQTDAYSTTLGLYKYGNVEYLRTAASSANGVNMYLDYNYPGESIWRNAYHLFCDPGQSDNAPTSYYVGSGASWRGHMCSWWWQGKDCAATSKFHAHN